MHFLILNCGLFTIVVLDLKKLYLFLQKMNEINSFYLLLEHELNDTSRLSKNLNLLEVEKMALLTVSPLQRHMFGSLDKFQQLCAHLQ